MNSMKLIKVYGERNTNTNYFSKLIELNLNLKEVEGVVPSAVLKLQKLLPGNELIRDLYFALTYGKNLGWKHTAVRPPKELNQYKIVSSNLIFLTITKNPYSWLLSLYRNPYHQYYSHKPSFEEFLNNEWKTIGRDNIEGDLPNPIELWNIKNKSYLQLDSNTTIRTTTESIFQEPEAVINEICERFDVKKKSVSFVNYERSTKNQSKDSEYYRDYYLLEKWRENLSDEAISIINASIDRNLMEHYGYKVL